MSEYVVTFERAEDGGWGAYLADLPGVVALGQTRDEVAAGIQQALDTYAERCASRSCYHCKGRSSQTATCCPEREL